MCSNVILIGPTGSGKTTVGAKAAAILGLQFIDIDALLTNKWQISIPSLFKSHGELFFRQEEAKIIQESMQYKNALIVCGAGSILQHATRQLLKSQKMVVYLQVDIGQQLKRLKASDRPLLQDASLLTTLISMAQLRNQLYSSTANLCINANKEPALVVQEFIQKVTSF